MELADPLIEDITKQVCEKTNIPVFMLNSGRYITLLCCCPTFTEHVKKELTQALGEEYVKANFHFRTGHIDYL